jgi:hypothetical protein
VARPIYREVLPARPGSVLVGAAAATVWMMLFGFLAHSARAYAWWTIVAGLVAWAVSAVLVRAGDRGVAAGVALASGVGVAIAMSVVLVRWTGGHWLLW